MSEAALVLTVAKQQQLAIHTMAHQVLATLTKEAPFDAVRRQSLALFIDQLEGALVLACWVYSGPTKPLPRGGCTIAFFSILTEALEPCPSDAGIFVEELNQLRATAETLRSQEAVAPDAQAALRSMLGKIHALTEAGLSAS